MARLKVTGYLDTADFDRDQLDPESKSGLTEEAYEETMELTKLIDLEEVEINRV